jgi:hypothetical protein
MPFSSSVPVDILLKDILALCEILCKFLRNRSGKIYIKAIEILLVSKPPLPSLGDPLILFSSR